MDALRHADAVLAALHRTHPECVLPGFAGSPMDDIETLVIPRALIDACDPLAEPSVEVEVMDAGMMRLATQPLAAQPRRIEPRAS